MGNKIGRTSSGISAGVSRFLRALLVLQAPLRATAFLSLSRIAQVPGYSTGRSLRKLPVMRAMELWIDGRVALGSKGTHAPDSICAAVDAAMARHEGASRLLLTTEQCVLDSDGPLMVLMGDGKVVEGGRNGGLAGVVVDIASPSDVDRALAAVGSVDWVIMVCKDWTMIPVENVVAAASGGPTRVCVKIKEAQQVQGAAFGLQVGVDALLLDMDDREAWEAARQAAASRSATSSAAVTEQKEEEGSKVALAEAVVDSVEPGGVGDRVCLDLIQMLKEGEGVLVGSSALGLVLVQAEVLASQYVPPRPFRVNAGPVHSYVLMEDGSTKYLSEVQAGDKVRVVDAEGHWRAVTVGRCKIESRPMVKVSYRWEEGDGVRQAQVFLQQAETVRFVCRDSSGASVAVTDIRPGAKVLVRSRARGTHIGRPISAKVTEK